VQLTLFQQISDNILTIPQLLADHVNLLTFATPADLPVAKAAFTNGVDLYLAASTYIRSRPASTGTNFLFQWDLGEDIATQLKEAKFRQGLVDVRSSLAGAKAISTSTNVTVNLTRHFDGSTPLRSLLPVFRTNDHKFWANTLPDATFGGLIQGVNRAQVEKGFKHARFTPDTRYSLTAKGKWFVQTNSGSPLPTPYAGLSSAPYVAYVAVESGNYTPGYGSGYGSNPFGSDSILGASLLTLGNPAPTVLEPEGTVPYNMPGFKPSGGSIHSGRVYSVLGPFQTLDQMNSRIPLGTYVFAITNAFEGLQYRTNVLTRLLTEADFPAPPHVQNWAAAQQVDPSQDFVLRWDTFVNGTTNDFIQVTLTMTGGPMFEATDVYRSPQPWEAAALNGTATSIVLSKDLFSFYGTPYSTYTARILFAKRLASIPNTPPGAPGDSAAFSQTDFSLGVQSSAPDYYIYRTGNYVQTNAVIVGPGLPVIASPSGGPCSLSSVDTSQPFRGAYDLYSQNLDVLGVYFSGLTLPNGTVDANGDQNFPQSTEAGLAALLPSGDYTIQFNNPANPDALIQTVATLPSTSLSAPLVANFTAAQAIDPMSDFTFTWDSSGNASDLVEVNYQPLCNAYSDPGYYPQSSEFTLLVSGAHSYTIPAYTLDLGQTYLLTVQVRRGTRYVGAVTPQSLGEAYQIKRTRLLISTRSSLPPPLQTPSFIAAPTLQRATNGGTVQFAVVTGNATAFAYQWFKGAQLLQDDAHFSGSQSPVLTIQGVSSSDLAGYTVRLTDALGSATTTAPASIAIVTTTTHSADYRAPFGQIDGTEVNRVLSYWRAGGYHLDAAGVDGFAPGVGPTNGMPHSADYHAPYWQMDGTEVNRVLSYWRAGGYHPDPTGVDGFAPGAP